MPSSHHKTPIHRFLHSIGESPILLLEWLQYFLLAWVLIKTLIGFGGFIAYGEPMVGVSAVLIILAAVHGLVVLFRRERHGLDWELLLPLPFLAYAWFHYRFVSPAPWDAALFLTVFVQAYVIFFIVFNTAHGSRTALVLLSICQVVVVIALLGAFFQYYQFPEWMVTLERERNPAYLSGAAGFLMDPSNLGSLLILFWPLSVLMVWVRRFSGPIRILNGFLVLAILVGFLLSSHRFGLGVLGFLIVLLPFFLEGKFRHRWRIWISAMAAIVVLLPFFWYATDALYDRIIYFLEYPSDELAQASIQSGWALFFQNPVTGSGLGSFSHYWEYVRPAGVDGNVLYAMSGLAGTFGELGIVGFLLLVGPVVILFFRGLKFWAGMPYRTVSKDVKSRIERFPKGHPSREKMQRAHGRMPSTKILIGGIVLGISAFSLYALRDYALALPLHLFILSCLLALLAYASRPGKRVNPARWQGMATGLIPMVLAVWAFSFGAPRFYSQHITYSASENLDSLIEEPDRIFLDPGILSVLMEEFSLASQLNPQNADAWIGIGRTHLARIHADIWPSRELAEEARPALEAALELAPRSWVAHYEMARVLSIIGADAAKIDEHLYVALQFAPNRVEPAAFLGSLLLLRDPDSHEGRELVAKALKLDPSYKPLESTARRLDLSGQEEGTAAAGSVFTESLLAEQFGLRGNLEERILGAGIMTPMESILPEPDS